VAAVLFSLLGCGRGRSVATEGEVVSHPLGFSVVVPDGWDARLHDEGVRLVSDTIEGTGYPTIRIEALTAHELPGDFLTGRGFRRADGRGSYRYTRFSNSIGTGFEMTAHLSTDRGYFVVIAQFWDDRLSLDRRYFRRQIWPIVNSITDIDATEERD